jgi:hypothetical protein
MPFNDDLNTDTGMFAMRQQPSDDVQAGGVLPCIGSVQRAATCASKVPGLSLAAEQVSRQYLYQRLLRWGGSGGRAVCGGV